MQNDHPEQWNGKSRGGSFGYAFFVFLIKYCGLRSAYAFLALVAFYFIPFAPRATAAIWDYYRRRLRQGRCTATRNLYRHYYRFGQTLIDKIAVGAGLADRYKFEFDNYEQFLQVLQGDTGVVVLGAHVGCWEIGAHFFGQYGRKMNEVMFDAEYQRIREVLERNVESRNYKIIPVNESSIEAILQIKVALNRGEYVCFQEDRCLNHHHVLRVPFLQGEALFPEGPFLIATKLKVPMAFYFAMREKGRRYRFYFKVIEAQTQIDTAKVCQLYVQALEEIVSRYPDQWFNFYKFWQ